MLTKEEVQELIINSITKSLGTVAEAVSKGKKEEDEKNDKGTVINIDAEAIAKSVKEVVGKAFEKETNNDDDDDDDDDIEFEDDYDAMSTDELKKECKDRDIKVFSKHRDKDLKKKLREYDKEHSNDGKTEDEIQEAKIKNATASVAKALGMKAEDIVLNIKGKKKSKVEKSTSKVEEDENDDNENEVDLSDPAQLQKAFNELDKDEKSEILDSAIGAAVNAGFEKTMGRKPEKKVEDEDDDD